MKIQQLLEAMHPGAIQGSDEAGKPGWGSGNYTSQRPGSWNGTTAEAAQSVYKHMADENKARRRAEREAKKKEIADRKKAERHDLIDSVSRIIQLEVTKYVPDSDPIEEIYKKIEELGIPQAKIPSYIGMAMKRVGFKNYQEYLDHMVDIASYEPTEENFRNEYDANRHLGKANKVELPSKFEKKIKNLKLAPDKDTENKGYDPRNHRGSNVEEAATAGATSSANVATLGMNPALSPGNARGKKSYTGTPGHSGTKAPPQPKVTQPKTKSGAAKNALDMKGNIFGQPIKR